MKLLFPLAFVLLVVVLIDASSDVDEDSFVVAEVDRKDSGRKNETTHGTQKPSIKTRTTRKFSYETGHPKITTPVSSV
jgi:hypothetical protein